MTDFEHKPYAYVSEILKEDLDKAFDALNDRVAILEGVANDAPYNPYDMEEPVVNTATTTDASWVDVASVELEIGSERIWKTEVRADREDDEGFFYGIYMAYIVTSSGEALVIGDLETFFEETTQAGLAVRVITDCLEVTLQVKGRPQQEWSWVVVGGPTNSLEA